MSTRNPPKKSPRGDSSQPAEGSPTFFPSAADFRAWLEENADTGSELVVGFYKKGSGHPSMTWPESVDEALCVGWIDGVRKRIDDERYQIRFTPRKPGSIWSAVNIERVRVLTDEGRMKPAGIEAFERRSEKKSRVYAYEQKKAATLSPEDEKLFRKKKRAWAFFEKQPASYRQKFLWRIASAKQQATHDKRLAALIEASENGERLT